MAERKKATVAQAPTQPAPDPERVQRMIHGAARTLYGLSGQGLDTIPRNDADEMRRADVLETIAETAAFQYARVRTYAEAHQLRGALENAVLDARLTLIAVNGLALMAIGGSAQFTEHVQLLVPARERDDEMATATQWLINRLFWEYEKNPDLHEQWEAPDREVSHA